MKNNNNDINAAFDNLVEYIGEVRFIELEGDDYTEFHTKVFVNQDDILVAQTFKRDASLVDHSKITFAKTVKSNYICHVSRQFTEDGHEINGCTSSTILTEIALACHLLAMARKQEDPCRKYELMEGTLTALNHVADTISEKNLTKYNDNNACLLYTQLLKQYDKYYTDLIQRLNALV